MHRRKIRSTLSLAYALCALGPQACHRWQAVDEPTVAPPVGVWSGDGGVVEAEEATDESVAARDAGQSARKAATANEAGQPARRAATANETGAPAPMNETRERRAEHEKPDQPRRAD